VAVTIGGIEGESRKRENARTEEREKEEEEKRGRRVLTSTNK